MKETSFFQTRKPHAFAGFLLLFLLLFSSVSSGTAQAAAARATFQNPAYTFTATDGTSVSTTANSGETTVLIFGYIGCGKTRSTLESVASSNWVKRSDIRAIFAETNMHSQEEVLSYAQGYQCPDLTFCYDDEWDQILAAMLEYASLYNITRADYPVIVLIDKQNTVQNALTGAQTAGSILNEIKKFEPIDENETDMPPSDSGFANFAFGLTGIDHATVSTKTNPNETTVLIFGYTTCGYTAATLRDIHSSSWVSRSDIRVIFADVYGATLSQTAEFAQNYPGQNILFCHDEAMLNYNYAMSYLGLLHLNGGDFPYIVFIDPNNRVQVITQGPKTADELIAEIEKFPQKNPNPGDGQTPGGDTNPGGSQTPDKETPAPDVSDVTGVKAASDAKTIKLTWDAVLDATGYTVYQWNDSGNAWEEKATLNAATTSHVIQGLTPGSVYRFGVRAFVQLPDKAPVYSKSYAIADTATAPDAVKLKVTPGKKKATLKWNKTKGATGYTIYYKTKAKGAWKKLKNTKGVKFTKSKLKSGATYYFAVQAYKKYNNVTYAGNLRSKKVKIK